MPTFHAVATEDLLTQPPVHHNAPPGLRAWLDSLDAERDGWRRERLKAEQAAAQKKDAAQEGKPDTDGNEAEAGSPAAKDAATQKPSESPVEAKASDTDTSAAALYSLAPRKEDGDAHD